MATGVYTARGASVLFAWPRTGDEDIHESSGALLPVRAGRHVGNADKSTKQIEWVEVFPYVAALDRALYKCINRSLDLSSGSFINLRWSSDQRVQGWGDDLFGRDVVNEKKHPAPKRLDRRQFLGKLPLCCR